MARKTQTKPKAIMNATGRGRQGTLHEFGIRAGQGFKRQSIITEHISTTATVREPAPVLERTLPVSARIVIALPVHTVTVPTFDASVFVGSLSVRQLELLQLELTTMSQHWYVLGPSW